MRWDVWGIFDDRKWSVWCRLALESVLGYIHKTAEWTDRVFSSNPSRRELHTVSFYFSSLLMLSVDIQLRLFICARLTQRHHESRLEYLQRRERAGKWAGHKMTEARRVRDKEHFHIITHPPATQTNEFKTNVDPVGRLIQTTKCFSWVWVRI